MLCLRIKYVKDFPISFYFGKNDIQKFMFLVRKGVLCYKYINLQNKFKEQLLSSKESVGITDKDPRHSQRVWNKSNINIFNEHPDLYNIIAVLLLYSVLKSF